MPNILQAKHTYSTAHKRSTTFSSAVASCLAVGIYRYADMANSIQDDMAWIDDHIRSCYIKRGMFVVFLRRYENVEIV